MNFDFNDFNGPDATRVRELLRSPLAQHMAREMLRHGGMAPAEIELRLRALFGPLLHEAIARGQRGPHVSVRPDALVPADTLGDLAATAGWPRLPTRGGPR